MGITTLNRYGSRATPSAVLWVRLHFWAIGAMPDVKLAVRNDVLGKRRALSTESRKQKSQAIVDSLIELALFEDAMTIATYLPLKSEVDLSRLLWLEHRSKCLVAPRTLPNFELSFHRVRSSDALEIGFGDVQQPTASAEFVSVDKIDLFLVPLAACDRQGNRLGFGKGYYDRALADAPGFKLGIGFHCQLVDHVPFDSYDVPMNGFISEEGLIQF
jgi:5-formyltetrahydrofolate cyclo-ligase